ncbi:MAG: hypothetical protein H0V17_23985 [Deltaproteobacteria bacterium]|nr:hypothetical protein [Deltaproteobacteria bacterium]
MKYKLFVPAFLLALLSAGVFAACKQDEGERCQVNADCEDSLICNQGTNPPSCQATVGGGIDATVPDADPDGPVDSNDAPDANDAPPI